MINIQSQREKQILSAELSDNEDEAAGNKKNPKPHISNK